MSHLKARRSTRAMNFYCNDPSANEVSLVGDFNGWNPKANPMRQQPDGVWFTTVEMHHGHQRYAFLIDKVLSLDPMAQGVTKNDEGDRVSLVAVTGF
ncbi:MAG: glycoside hydrolase family 13 [Limisphaerales bacterium]|jgi:1,4-alpha-glucan branching enzyme